MSDGIHDGIERDGDAMGYVLVECKYEPPQPTGTEAAVCQDIAQRQRLGMSKYGTTVSDNPLSQRRWLQHAYEECLDQAIYLKRAILEMDRVIWLMEQQEAGSVIEFQREILGGELIWESTNSHRFLFNYPACRYRAKDTPWPEHLQP